MKLKVFSDERQMYIRIVRGVTTPEDIHLFKHCTDNCEVVRKKYFNEVIKPLLAAHGVRHWEYIQ